MRAMRAMRAMRVPSLTTGGGGMIKKLLWAFGRTWFTGALYILAAAGYAFYAVLWTIRFMQTTKRVLIFLCAGCLLLLAAAVYLFVPIHRSARCRSN